MPTRPPRKPVNCLKRDLLKRLSHKKKDKKKKQHRAVNLLLGEQNAKMTTKIHRGEGSQQNAVSFGMKSGQVIGTNQRRAIRDMHRKIWISGRTTNMRGFVVV
jgi:hypothetical protein